MAASIAGPNTSVVCWAPALIQSTLQPRGASSSAAFNVPCFTGIQNGLFSSPRTAIFIGFGAFWDTGATVPSSGIVAVLSKVGPGGSFFFASPVPLAHAALPTSARTHRRTINFLLVLIVILLLSRDISCSGQRPDNPLSRLTRPPAQVVRSHGKDDYHPDGNSLQKCRQM